MMAYQSTNVRNTEDDQADRCRKGSVDLSFAMSEGQ